MFTIEVKKKEKDEKFSFEDLEFVHQDCLGGEIKIGFMEGYVYPGPTFPTSKKFYELSCSKCGRIVWILQQSEAPIKIIKTAVDGQNRKLDGYQGTLARGEIKGISDDADNEIEITVVQEKQALSTTEEKAEKKEEAMFTIIVPEKGRDERFSFIDIVEKVEVFDNGCGGGEVEWSFLTMAGEREEIEVWHFRCKRCEGKKSFDGPFIKEKKDIILTAIDGKERILQKGRLRVIQEKRPPSVIQRAVSKTEEIIKKKEREKEREKKRFTVKVSRKKIRVISTIEELIMLHKNNKETFLDLWKEFKKVLSGEYKADKEITATILIVFLISFGAISYCFLGIIAFLCKIPGRPSIKGFPTSSKIDACEKVDNLWLLLLETYIEESKKNNINSNQLMEEVKKLSNNYLQEVNRITKEHELGDEILLYYKKQVLKKIYAIAIQRKAYKWAESFAKEYGLQVV